LRRPGPSSSPFALAAIILELAGLHGRHERPGPARALLRGRRNARAVGFSPRFRHRAQGTRPPTRRVRRRALVGRGVWAPLQGIERGALGRRPLPAPPRASAAACGSNLPDRREVRGRGWLPLSWRLARVPVCGFRNHLVDDLDGPKPFAPWPRAFTSLICSAIHRPSPPLQALDALDDGLQLCPGAVGVQGTSGLGRKRRRPWPSLLIPGSKGSGSGGP